MKINEVKIYGIGGIKELALTFNPGFNAICGCNGIGKTTILNVIANGFSTTSRRIKRNANYPEGRFSIEYTDCDNELVKKDICIKEFEPLEKGTRYNGNMRDVLYLMFFCENRSIEYMNLTSIPRDHNANQYYIADDLELGINIDDLKGWFNNRCLFNGVEGSLSLIQKTNLEIAIKSFSILDPTIEFKTIDAGSLDIILSSRNGDIYFEYLSTGYKSCIYLIMGLIKEIEYRFGKYGISGGDFDGVVLIDEIDLHLHPTWQAKLIDALKTIFPLAQFIVTTHSPSVLQILEKNEIIPLTQDEFGNVSIKELNLSEYGLQGWSIEEILRDVMEMPETTSKFFEDTMQAFEKALDMGDIESVKTHYAILMQMLHPDSVIRRLMNIEVAGLGIEK